MFDLSFNKLSERFFKGTTWPAAESIAHLVDHDHVFCLLYKVRPACTTRSLLTPGPLLLAVQPTRRRGCPWQCPVVPAAEQAAGPAFAEAGQTAGDVLQAPVRHAGAAHAGPAAQVLGELRAPVQHHPQHAGQHAGQRPSCVRPVRACSSALRLCAQGLPGAGGTCLPHAQHALESGGQPALHSHPGCLVLAPWLSGPCLAAAAQRLALVHGGRVRVPVSELPAVSRQAQPEER